MTIEESVAADSQLRASLRALGTSAISDALDRLGLPGAAPGLLPLTDGFSVCGRAFTVGYEPVDSAGGTVGDYIDDVAAGQVVVLDNRGRLDCTVWGDILTYAAHLRGVAGTVIHGVCRDTARSLELGYAVFSRGRSMRTGKDRVRVAHIGGPVVIGEVMVRPGDWLVGDADGVVALQAAEAGRVAEAAAQIELAEQSIRQALADGEPLASARDRLNYHGLQSREGSGQ